MPTDPLSPGAPAASPSEVRRATTLAYLKVLLAGTLWGTAGPFSVTLHQMGVPAESLALLRPAVGTVVLALFLGMRGVGAFRLSRRDALVLLGWGGVLVGVFQLAYQVSTARVGVPATVALLYLAPAWVVGVSALLLAERLTLVRGALALLSVGGVWLTVLGARGVDVELGMAGILWGCLTGISFGTYTLFGKVTGGRRGALVPLFWSTVGGTLGLAAWFALGERSLILPQGPGPWAVMVVFGVLTMAAAPLLLFSALRTLEAGRAAIGTTVEPLVAAILAMFLLDQTLTGTGWLGLGVLLVGVVGAYLAGPSRPGPSGPVSPRGTP